MYDKQLVKRIGIGLAVSCGLALSTFLLLKLGTKAAEPITLPDGAIPIPSEYREEFERSLQALEKAEEISKKESPTVQRILNLSLYVAKVPAAKWADYEFDRSSRTWRKKGSAPAPEQQVR